MLDPIRDALFRVITSTRGDTFPPFRVQKDLARRLNVALGSPLATREELDKRRAARARLASLRRDRVAGHGSNGATHDRDNEAATPTLEQAPVVVYFEKDRNARELTRIQETLEAKQIAFKLLDVTADEPALEFVLRESRCERDQLPVVFVGDLAIGPFPKLVEADVSGALAKALRG
jgi:glutaredoxin